MFLFSTFFKAQHVGICSYIFRPIYLNYVDFDYNNNTQNNWAVFEKRPDAKRYVMFMPSAYFSHIWWLNTILTGCILSDVFLFFCVIFFVIGSNC